MVEENFYRVLVRRDFDYVWEKSNLVVPKYELICVIEEDHGNLISKFKQGDGEHTYNELDFIDEIPKFFKVCNYYINLDGVQCYAYQDCYKETKRNTVLHEKLKEFDNGLVHLKNYFGFDYHNLENYIDPYALAAAITIKLAHSHQKIELNAYTYHYMNLADLFKEHHNDITLYTEDKDVYNKLIKFLESYKRGE